MMKMREKNCGKRVSEFCSGVYNIVRRIKQGQILTYAEVARRVGKPKAGRAVGNALNKNYNPKIPCHRVIRSDGKIGRYNRGAKLKLKLLRKEGTF